MTTLNILLPDDLRAFIDEQIAQGGYSTSRQYIVTKTRPACGTIKQAEKINSSMAYSDFTLAKVKETFDLTLEETQNLFVEVEGVQPSELLTLILQEYIPLATAINTEKARSELLIAQVLTEMRRQLKYQIALFSGTEFNVDNNRGLVGFCDFIISGSKEQYYITAPVIIIAEAKNENIKGGLGQCIAAMIGAQLFNQKAGNDIELIYGVVTTGTNWKFLTLEGNTVFIDSIEYYIKEVDKILGILLKPLQTFISKTSSFSPADLLEK